ncbi:MAG TPA: hypothetical protein VM370_01190 [Candidatus Thermoplasmatota archaeon]|nr:hypothetical protein [Candidatus Thermoplasmatota archaeon]
MNARQRSALADALLGAGATLILLFSTADARGGVMALAIGIALVVVGVAMLWGTPRPELRTRMLASVAGLLVGFGGAIGGRGMWLSIGVGAFLLAGILLQVRTRR